MGSKLRTLGCGPFLAVVTLAGCGSCSAAARYDSLASPVLNFDPATSSRKDRTKN